jgi:hypothetical protein
MKYLLLLLLLTSCAKKVEYGEYTSHELNKSGQYTLHWDSLGGAAGYKIYHGYDASSTIQIIDVGYNLSHEFNSLAKDQVHYFSVGSYNNLGIEISRTQQIKISF